MGQLSDSPMPTPLGAVARSGGDSATRRDGVPFAVAPPRVELPRGGGAIRGMGETFTANPVTGTGSMTVPVSTTPGRAGLGPRLELSYDSGAGNGVFGFGWTLDLPRVSRRTDKGLPRYDDAAESDGFLLSGAEDLVPVLDTDLTRHEDRATVPGYVVHRYRPRIEGLFARIERWTRLSDADVHWRSISRDNVLTVYGADARSRIADPGDATRVFTWLVCETRDDKGNVVRYDHKPEDGEGVDLAAAHERNRGSREDSRRTVNRYLKRIRYGNRTPLLDASGRRPRFLSETQIRDAGWMFEVVLDYGEHHPFHPHPADVAPWTSRADPFSTYRAGFEVRTARRCRRVLMFHHFAQEPGVGDDCLVRSTDFTYADESVPPDPRYPIHSFVRSVTQCGYRRQGDGYLKRSLPPVEFEYSTPVVQDTVRDVDTASLENLPAGLAGTAYQWIDLHGEGVPGPLTEQADAWYYKRNLSPVSDRAVEFSPTERVAVKPNLALAGGHAQLMDLAGDGRADLVVVDGPTPGFHEHDSAESWGPFRSFTSRLNRDIADPDVRLIDLDGDGRADVLISEDDAFLWHASLGAEGFAPGLRVRHTLDEEAGPRLVFADAAQSIHLADMSGDGGTDLVRVRNGEICYWPNLGYGRFGAKVSMDQAPHLDRPDGFDQRRVRLADIDGSGGADLVYLAGDGVTLYFNQSGNGWSAGQRVAAFPAVDDIAAIQVVDLMGNGTACLVWSSPLPGNATRPMRYVDLMGGQKPHLLTRSINNLGAETVVHYTPSTRFYLADKLAGRPWITKVPFPVHVVERVETVDRVSGNRFVTRYAYHHGYFDEADREFRGFGMVEQWDTEEFAALNEDGAPPSGTNVDASSHVPPVLTRTWFHTGVHLGRQSISRFFSGLADDELGEYYREPGRTDAEAGALLLDDTVLPAGLTLDEEREACRALRGVMLRQEIYALDGHIEQAHPYTVTEQNRTVRLLQPRGGNRHAVFLTHAREAITYRYERNPADPRITHALTLAVDDYGGVLISAAVGYGRRRADPALSDEDQDRQAERHITCTENAFTNPIDSIDDQRTPLPSESRVYELREPEVAADTTRLGFEQLLDSIETAAPLEYEEAFTANRVQKRLIQHMRTQYRPDDLGIATGDAFTLLPLGRLQSLALPGESYQLALTAGLTARLFGDKVSDSMLAADGGYVHSQGDASWWLRSGRVFLSPGSADDPATEVAHARRHFFQPHRFHDPFHRAGFETETVVAYDHDLAVREVRDALGNVTTAVHDYRVVQPRLMTDPNGNRTEVAFDALGMVVGTAVMGKDGHAEGDSLLGFAADLDEATALAHLEDPYADPHAVLQHATTRTVFDLFAYLRTRERAQPQPVVSYALARETHDTDLMAGEQTRIQHTFSYCDGFGREIQRKIQAEPGPLVRGGARVDPRWVGSGWAVFNNKGAPVRRYEPFFSASHRFEFARAEGVSPVLLYDAAGRVVATLHPNHTWEKVVFDAWRQEDWDVSDTVLIADPAADPEDPDVADNFRRLPQAEYLPGWHAQRAGGALGALEQVAAVKAAVHAGTPSVTHLDSLGRAFLTVTHNKLKRGDSAPDDPPEEASYRTRRTFDIEGNTREVVDALDRIVMRYDYDMLGGQVYSASMDAGERWTLGDVAGKARYGWNSRGHRLRTSYDVLGRPSEVRLRAGGEPEILVGRTIYGERRPAAAADNLRGRPYQRFDGAGVVTTAAYDFKGNAVSSSRQFAADYRTTPDWSSTVALEADVFTTSTRLDALNRPVTQTTPDNSVIRRTYNEANLLDSIDANLRGGTAGGELVWTSFVTDLDHNARGQRERIAYGNGVATTYDYDPLTFRLIGLRTFNGTEALQDLSYTYDPAGNITHIEDDAQPTIYFRNRRVEPGNDFGYDATYQLIEATGREHLGQIDGTGPRPPTAPDAFNGFHTGLDHPGDGNAMGRYRESYVYDAAGNILEMRHAGTDPGHPGWTRTYNYVEDSAIRRVEQSPNEPRVFSNRLSSTQVGGGAIEPCTYDAHGSMISMPHLTLIRWNYLDQVEASARQVVNDGSPETTYYVYDGGGQRVRKVSERAAAPGESTTRSKERVYLGGFEIYRELDGGGAVTLERETLHLMDGEQRIALVETRTRGDDGSPAQLARYQLGNHIGSAGVEVDDAGEVISYEEYSPYGGTTYQATGQRIKASPKRYRYSSKERDEETGFSYHGARYYLPWLGRWLSIDPLFMECPQASPYLGVGNNPTMFSDQDGRQITAMERTIDRNAREFMTGKITEQELKDRTLAQSAGTGIGGILGFGLVAAWLAPEFGVGLLATLGRNPQLLPLGTTAVGGVLQMATGAELSPGGDDVLIAAGRTATRLAGPAESVVELGAEAVEGGAKSFLSSTVKALGSEPHITPGTVTEGVHVAANVAAKATVSPTSREAVRRMLGADSLADHPELREMWLDALYDSAISRNTRAGAGWTPKNKFQQYMDKLQKSGGNFAGITNDDVIGAWGVVTDHFKKKFIAQYGNRAWESFDDLHHAKLKSLFPEDAFDPANLFPVLKADHELWHNIYSQGAENFSTMAPQFLVD